MQQPGDGGLGAGPRPCFLGLFVCPRAPGQALYEGNDGPGAVPPDRRPPATYQDRPERLEEYESRLRGL